MIDYVMVGGHSMGGMVAAMYAAEHPVSADGVVLLAAYPTQKLKDLVKVLSVYGAEDRELDREEYEKGRMYFPADVTEVVIDGGNHAQFGNYGNQKGDDQRMGAAKSNRARDH